MDDRELLFSDNEPRLVLQRRRDALYETEKAFATRRDVSAMLEAEHVNYRFESDARGFKALTECVLYCLKTQKNGSSTAIEEPAHFEQAATWLRRSHIAFLACQPPNLLVLLVPQTLGVDRLARLRLQELVGKAENLKTAGITDDPKIQLMPFPVGGTNLYKARQTSLLFDGSIDGR